MKATTTTGARRLGRLAAVLGVSVAIAAQAAPAGAAGATDGGGSHYSFKGQLAEAEWVSRDESGCVVTDTYVSAVDGRVKFESGRPDAESYVFVGTLRYDECARQMISLAVGRSDLAAEAFQVDRFETASLAATVEMSDVVNGGSFPMQVQLTWTGYGDRERARTHLIIDYPDYQLNSRFNGTMRAASTAGLLSDGTTNYASGSQVYGAIASVNSGTVESTN